MLLFKALNRGRALGRKEVVESGLLSAEEWERALGSLRDAGVVQRSQSATRRKTAGARFVLSGKPMPTRVRRSRTQRAGAGNHMHFDALLNVWSIALPPDVRTTTSVYRTLVHRLSSPEDEADDLTLSQPLAA